MGLIPDYFDFMPMAQAVPDPYFDFSGKPTPSPASYFDFSGKPTPSPAPTAIDPYAPGPPAQNYFDFNPVSQARKEHNEATEAVHKSQNAEVHPDLNPLHIGANVAGGFAEGWKDLWHGLTNWDDEYGIVGRASKVLSPLATVPRMIIKGATTAVGLEPTGSLVEQVTRQGHNMSGLGYGLALAGAMTGDVLVDPLTYVTAGTGPLAKRAFTIAKEAPEAGQILKEGAAVSSAAFRPGYQLSRALTPEFVRHVAVPRMLKDSSEVAAEAIKATPVQHAARQSIFDAAFATEKARFEPMLEAARQAARAGKPPKGVVGFPTRTLFDPDVLINTTKKTWAMQDLANHMAQVEVGILHQLPAVRMGLPFNIMKSVEIPGSRAVMGKIYDVARGVLGGKWDPVTVMRRTSEEHAPHVTDIPETATQTLMRRAPGAPANVGWHQWQPHVATGLPLTPPDMPSRWHWAVENLLGLPKTATIGEIFDALSRRQFSYNARARGITRATRDSKGKLELSGLTDTLLHEMQPQSILARPAIFDMYHTLYQGLHDAVASDMVKGSTFQSRVIAPTDLASLKDTLAAFDVLRQAPVFWKKALGGTYTRTIYQDTVKSWLGARQELRKALSEWDLATQAMHRTLTPDELTHVPAAFDQIYSTKAFDRMERALQNFFGTQERLAALRTPYEYGHTVRKWQAKAGQTARELQDEASRVMTDALQTMRAQAPMTGVELLTKFPKDFWQDLAHDTIHDAKVGSVSAMAAKPAAEQATLAGAIYRVVDQQIDAMTTAGRMDMVEGLRAKTIVQDLARTGPEGMFKLAYTMDALENQGKHAQAFENMLDVIQQPVRSLLERSGSTMHQLKDADLRQLTSASGHFQTAHTIDPLNAVLDRMPFMMQAVNPWTLYKAMNGMLAKNQDLRGALTTVLRRFESEGSRANESGWESAKRWVIDDVREKIIRPVVGHNAPITQDMLRDVLEGSYRVSKYQPTLTLAAAGELPETVPGRNSWIADRSLAMVNEGMDALNRVFGSTLDSLRAANQIEAMVKQHMDVLYQEEIRAGIPISYKRNYAPLVVMGNWISRHFYDKVNMARKGVQKVGEATRDPALVSKSLAAANVRAIEHPAEWEFELEQARKWLGTPSGRVSAMDRFHVQIQPSWLRVQLDHNWMSVLAYRNQMHNRAISSRKFLADLRTVLPNEVIPLRYFPVNQVSKSLKGVPINRESMAAAGYHDLGTIIPSLTNWYAHEAIYKYLEEFAPTYAHDLEAEASLWGITQNLCRGLKRFNVSITPFYHGKNILGLSLVGGVPLTVVWKNLADAKKIAQKRVADGSFYSPVQRTTGESLRHPVATWKDYWGVHQHPFQLWADALKEHPLYAEADVAGAFPFKGQESMIPLPDQVAHFLGKKSTAGKVVATAWKPFASSERLLFDLYDRASRLALYEKYRKMGMDPYGAVDLVNLQLVDYSMRWANPQTRKVGYALAPFFAWHSGNWRLHPRQMLEDPRAYVVMHHLQESWNTMFGEEPDWQNIPALAHAMAMPWNKPGTPYQEYAFPEMPWENVTKPVGNLMRDPLSIKSYEGVWQYPIRRLQPPLRMLLEFWGDPGRRRELYKYGVLGAFNGTPNVLTGTPNRSGYLEDTFWGAKPWAEGFKPWVSKNTYQDPGGIQRAAAIDLEQLLGLIMRFEGMERTRKKGRYKIHRGHDD